MDVTTLCEKCQHQRPKIKSQTFTSLPEILMVQMNRFESQYIDGEVRYHKIQQYIEHPQLITVNDISYSLKSIIERYGETPFVGHYTVSIIDEQGAWVKCNDSEILYNTESPKNGYMYLYEKSIHQTPATAQELNNEMDNLLANDVERSHIYHSEVFPNNFNIGLKNGCRNFNVNDFAPNADCNITSEEKQTIGVKPCHEMENQHCVLTGNDMSRHDITCDKNHQLGTSTEDPDIDEIQSKGINIENSCPQHSEVHAPNPNGDTYLRRSSRLQSKTCKVVNDLPLNVNSKIQCIGCKKDFKNISIHLSKSSI